MENNNLFDIFLNDDFIKDFTLGNDSETRSSVSLINTYMMMLDSDNSANWTAEMRHECAQIVQKQLCHILQSSELYGRIFDMLFCKDLPVELVDMKAFFDSFTDCVQRLLAGICVIELKSDGRLFAKSNKKMLNFMLLLYIRSAVLDGAVNITMVYSAEGSDLVIVIKINKKNDDLKNQYPNDDFFAKYQSHMNDAFAKKLGGEIFETNDQIKIILPNCIFKKDSGLVMKEASFDNDMGILNPYNIMLSDISNNLICW